MRELAHRRPTLRNRAVTAEASSTRRVAYTGTRGNTRKQPSLSPLPPPLPHTREFYSLSLSRSCSGTHVDSSLCRWWKRSSALSAMNPARSNLRRAAGDPIKRCCTLVMKSARASLRGLRELETANFKSSERRARGGRWVYSLLGSKRTLQNISEHQTFSS